MFRKTLLSLHRSRWPFGILALLLFFLSACSTSRPPLQITEATVSPDPLIGQVATLHVEFVSLEDEPLTTLEIFLPEGIKLVKGDLAWKGSLVANQPQTHDLSICAEFPGNYWLSIRARLWEAEDDFKFIAPETVILDITQTEARVTISENYHYTQPPDSPGPRILSTPLPESWISPCPK